MNEVVNKLLYKLQKNGIEKEEVKVLVDGNQLPPHLDAECVVKGDDKSYAIGAASIIAKVEQMKQMDDLHALYPEYNFNHNHGYGADRAHILAIIKYGITPAHRKSYKIKDLGKTLGEYKVGDKLPPHTVTKFKELNQS